MLIGTCNTNNMLHTYNALYKCPNWALDVSLYELCYHLPEYVIVYNLVFIAFLTVLLVHLI